MNCLVILPSRRPACTESWFLADLRPYCKKPSSTSRYLSRCTILYLQGMIPQSAKGSSSVQKYQCLRMIVWCIGIFPARIQHEMWFTVPRVLHQFIGRRWVIPLDTARLNSSCRRSSRYNSLARFLYMKGRGKSRTASVLMNSSS